MTIIEKILEFDLKKSENLILFSKVKNAIKKFKDTLNEDAFDDIKCCPTYIMSVMYPEADEKFKELWENTTTCRSNSEQSLNSLNCNKCWAKFITYDVDKQNGLMYISKDNDSHTAHRS